MVCQSFLYFDQNIFGFWEKSFTRGCQNCIRRVQKKALRTFLEKTWVFCKFCTVSGKVSDLCKTLTAGFPKHQSKRPGIFSRKTFKKLMTFLVVFVLWEKKFRTLGEKIQGRVMKITFYVSMRTFWRTNFLEKLLVFQ